MYYGAVEAGGTKFVCAVSNENFEIIDRMNIPTRNQTKPFNKCTNFSISTR